MKRIHMHWTAGGHTPNAVDLEHYHEVIDGNGKVHLGKFPIAANERCVPGRYAEHTRLANTGAIGIAVAAMAGAREAPFSPGAYPITRAQVEALCARVAALAAQYGIPITRQTVLTHAEVQPTLKIRQNQKWDIRWLPGMKAPGDALAVGDHLRAMILAKMKGQKSIGLSAASAPALKQGKLNMRVNWKKVRAGAYLSAAAIGASAAATGYATFDPVTGNIAAGYATLNLVTGMIDIAPFNLYVALPLIWSTIGAPLLAFIALIKGWGK